MPPSEEDRGGILFDHHGQLSAIKQAQTDINRRIGGIEKKQDALLEGVLRHGVLESRILELETHNEASGDTKEDWIKWVLQIVLGTILVSLLSKYGISVVLP